MSRSVYRRLNWSLHLDLELRNLLGNELDRLNLVKWRELYHDRRRTPWMLIASEVMRVLNVALCIGCEDGIFSSQAVLIWIKWPHIRVNGYSLSCLSLKMWICSKFRKSSLSCDGFVGAMKVKKLDFSQQWERKR